MISHNEVSDLDYHVTAKRTSPMQQELTTIGIDLAKKVWLLLDSRVVDVSRASAPTFATLSSLKSLLFNSLEKALRCLDIVGAEDPGIQEERARKRPHRKRQVFTA